MNDTLDGYINKHRYFQWISRTCQSVPDIFPHMVASEGKEPGKLKPKKRNE